MMRQKLIIYLAAIVLLNLNLVCASFLEPRFLARRQSGESEQESTTPKPPQPDATSQQQPPSTTTGNNGAPAPNNGRLYPDLPQGPVFLPPFNGHPNQQGHMPPFVPFNVAGVQRLNNDQQTGPFGPRMLKPPPRPMSAAERLQSQSFTNGLGKRLLSLVGIDVSQSENQTTTPTEGDLNKPESRFAQGPLQNTTVLNQLNKRVGMVMSGLSKMYNSTIQEQLRLLNERFKKESENSTNPWQQRVAQRVPEFFNQMAMKVSGAQEQLNRVWRDVVQVAQGNGSAIARQAPQNGGPPQRPSFFHAIDQFMNPHERQDGPAGNQDPEEFVNHFARSLGLGSGEPNQGQQQPRQMDLAAGLREFWQTQVQPQIGMMRNQMARVWRDLTTTGALTPDTIMRSRMPANNNNSSNGDLVDSLLKEADAESADFALVPPKDSANGNDQSSPATPTNSAMPKLSPEMQNKLMNMQRDLNQLWQGLSSSLQNAVANVRATLNPRQQFAFGQPDQMPDSSDPTQKEINGKVQDLSKLQREADVVYDTIQQQQRDTQQRQTFADRFRGFMNNVDLRNLDRLPDQIGAQVNRFGQVIGNFWNTIPERWDNMLAQRQNQANQAKLEAQLHSKTSTITAPASTAENPA